MSNAKGKPKASAPEAPKDARRGATRGSVAGTAGRCRKRGNSWNASAGAIGMAKRRGNPQAYAPDALKDARFGATRRSIAGKAGRCRSRGNLAKHRQAQPEEQSRGATQSLCAGCAEGREIRGNSKIGRRQSLRMQEAGQLATSSGGATGRAGPRGSSAGRAEGCGNRGNLKLHRGRSLRDAVSGATRRLSARLNGLMHGPGNL